MSSPDKERRRVDKMLAHLSRQRVAGGAMSPWQIADYVGVRPRVIQRTEERALRKLKEKLEPYLTQKRLAA